MGIEVIERIGSSTTMVTEGAKYAVRKNAIGQPVISDDHGWDYKPFFDGIDCQRGILKNSLWSVFRSTDDTPGPEAPSPTEKEPEVEGCFWIKRTGTSGGLYTCGKHYYVDEEGFFLDDGGFRTKFYGEDSGLWERVSEPAAPPVTPTRVDMESSTGVEGDITINWPYDQLSASEIKAAHERIRENMLKGFTSTKFTTPTEENKTMSVKIKQATLINGADADNFDTEQLLGIIRGEEASIERLEEFTAKSKAITNLIAKHEANVIALVEILDAREDSE